MKNWEMIFKEPMLERAGLFCQYVSNLMQQPMLLDNG
jgi:hypothetical protein